MSAESLLMQSVVITIIGMLVVFTFLIVMVWVMKGLGKLVAVLEKFFPQDVPQAAESAALFRKKFRCGFCPSCPSRGPRTSWRRRPRALGRLRECICRSR